jgi:hypothetical protein
VSCRVRRCRLYCLADYPYQALRLIGRAEELRAEEKWLKKERLLKGDKNAEA